MSTTLDIRAILDLLPHRYPFLLVDRVLEVEPGRIVAIKNVTINEPFFVGHFPNLPVMPGVLIIEALAQAAGIMSFHTSGKKADGNSVYYFVGIDGARFKRPVTAGDQLRLEVELIRSARSIWKFAGKALVDGQVACEAELMVTLREVEPVGGRTPAVPVAGAPSASVGEAQPAAGAKPSCAGDGTTAAAVLSGVLPS